MKKVYNTAVDAWLAALLLVALGIFIYSVVSEVQVSGVENAGLLLLLALVVIPILILCSIPCRYILTDDCLTVQAGLIKKKIPYGDIVKMSLSCNPLSAPAFSLKRVRIDLKKGFVLVSPKDRSAFIADIDKMRKAAKKAAK